MRSTSPRNSTLRNSTLRRTAIAALPAVGLLAGAMVAGAGTAGANPVNCSADCVNPVTVNRIMNRAFLSFTTAVPAKASLTLRYAGGPFVKTWNEASLGISHSFDTGKILNPGIVYHYTLAATDAAGRTWTETGTFKAAERTVVVTFDKVTISDDSDAGAGELTGWGRVGSTVAGLWGEQSISAYKVMSPKKSITLKHNSPNLTWEVAVQDDDVSFGEFDSCGSAPAFAVVENSCMDANVAKKTVSLPDDFGTYTFTSGASAPNQRLDFGADVSIKITVS